MSLKGFFELKIPWHFRQTTVSSLFNSWWAQGVGIGVGIGVRIGVVTLCYAHSCAWQAVTHVRGVYPGEQSRSQVHPGERDRGGHTYNITRTGTEDPKLSRGNTSPGILAGNGGGVCPRGGQSQPLRPMSMPRTQTEVDLHYSWPLL